MEKNLLPIGSVVLLKGTEKRLMVCGRIIASAETEKIYDYSGCIYPQGISDSETMFFFNDEDIDHIFFIGFQDEEELKYRGMLNRIAELDLEVRDGVIKEKKPDEE